MDIPVQFLGRPYQNLWDHKDNKCKNDARVIFFLQGERLWKIVRTQYRLTPTTVAKYPFIQFHAMHDNIILPLRGDPNKKALTTLFIFKDANIEREVEDRPEDWLTYQEKVST